MKAYLSINQKAFISIANSKGKKVDYIDGALFDWINTFTHSEKALKKLIDNKLFIWVNYTAIREDNPMANITSNDVVGRRLNKLVELGILEKYLSKEDGNKVFFHITQFAYDYLLESRELPTQKSEPLPTQKSDNSKLNNSKLDSKEKNTKKRNLEHTENQNKISINEIIEFYKKNISSKNAKVKEQLSYNAIVLHQEYIDKIIQGLRNYALIKPKDEQYICNLQSFVRENIYLDYQMLEQKKIKSTGLSVENTKAMIEQLYSTSPSDVIDCEVIS